MLHSTLLSTTIWGQQKSLLWTMVVSLSWHWLWTKGQHWNYTIVRCNFRTFTFKRINHGQFTIQKFASVDYFQILVSEFEHPNSTQQQVKSDDGQAVLTTFPDSVRAELDHITEEFRNLESMYQETAMMVDRQADARRVCLLEVFSFLAASISTISLICICFAFIVFHIIR